LLILPSRQRFPLERSCGISPVYDPSRSGTSDRAGHRRFPGGPTALRRWQGAGQLIHPVLQSHSRKALTPEEILKVLKVASESKRNLAMILLAYRHGMRASEVCELRLADLDLKNGQITIRRLKGSLTSASPA